MAEIISGRVRIREGFFEVVSAPAMTERVLRRLGLLLLESIDANEGPEETAARIESEAPELASWIRETFGGLAQRVFIIIITAIATAFAERAINSPHPETVINNLTLNQCAMSPEQREASVRQVLRRLKNEESAEKDARPSDSENKHQR
ncbi:MAG: hypothetical protein WAK19_13870 [Candidatus Cybelea sp.]